MCIRTKHKVQDSCQPSLDLENQIFTPHSPFWLKWPKAKKNKACLVGFLPFLHCLWLEVQKSLPISWSYCGKLWEPKTFVSRVSSNKGLVVNSTCSPYQCVSGWWKCYKSPNQITLLQFTKHGNERTCFLQRPPWCAIPTIILSGTPSAADAETRIGWENCSLPHLSELQQK